MERREQLYTVVRDTMVRAGVLSAGYKFKVLSLDQRGGQFLVMIDLSPEYENRTDQQREIEALLAQSARARFNIFVTAVYWRVNEWNVKGPAVASRPVPLAPQMTTNSRPAPMTSRSAPLTPSAPPPVATAPASRFEPLHPDEVEAFKQALANAAASSRISAPPLGATSRSAPLLPSSEPLPAPAPRPPLSAPSQPAALSPSQQPLPAPPPLQPATITGFQDTLKVDEHEPHEGRGADLSATQYGELR
jgi:hypothetical protein